MTYDTIGIVEGTADIALLCDADAPPGDDTLFYSMDNLQDLADGLSTGEIMEVNCYKQMPNRYLVRDDNGVVCLCETQEAAEAIIDASLGDKA